jgi:hypothetical protein
MMLIIYCGDLVSLQNTVVGITNIFFELFKVPIELRILFIAYFRCLKLLVQNITSDIKFMNLW